MSELCEQLVLRIHHVTLISNVGKEKKARSGKKIKFLPNQTNQLFFQNLNVFYTEWKAKVIVEIHMWAYSRNLGKGAFFEEGILKSRTLFWGQFFAKNFSNIWNRRKFIRWFHCTQKMSREVPGTSLYRDKNQMKFFSINLFNCDLYESNRKLMQKMQPKIRNGTLGF